MARMTRMSIHSTKPQASDQQKGYNTMRGTKYLSELIDINSFQTDKLNVVESPTGSGKSYFALSHIPSLVDDPYHKIVYLIDTRNGKEQIIDTYDMATPESRGWYEDVLGINFRYSEDVVVMTYARFGIYCSENPSFPSRFEYIICDELPSLIQFESFSHKPNSHSIAKEALEKAVKNTTTKVIALTATPQRLKKFNASLFTVPINKDELIQYDTIECIPFTNLDYIIADADEEDIGMCYTGRITTMLNIERKARERGLKPICIWSTSNADHPMTDEQLAARESILKNYTLPSQYNFLIINSSSETSIKIKSQIDYVIVNSSNEDTQIQVRGRVNSDLKKLYMPLSRIEDLVIPDDFLGKDLFTEDKNALCETLGLMNANGRPYRWPHVKNVLIDLGYTVSEGRKGNLRFSNIMKA